MTIEGGTRNKLTAGMRLVARYKGEPHVADVLQGNEGRLRFRLADGREFKSPSAAATAVMGGIAANGWRFWSVEGAEPAMAARGASAAGQTPHEATPKPRPTCTRCGKQFVGPTQLAHHEANADRLCAPA